MLVILDDVHTDKHAKWSSWTTQEIRRYLKKYGKGSIVPGRCSSHRRKKIKFLQNLLDQRERAEHLILGVQNIPF